MEAILVKDQKAAAFVMEDGTFEGVYRITEKVCGDVEQVTGVRPKIIKWQGELQPAQVYVATLGNSEMSEAIAEEEGIELSSLCGKRELRDDRQAYKSKGHKSVDVLRDAVGFQ